MTRTDHHDHTHGPGHAHHHPHPPEDNSWAGQGAVMIDIGGDVGALIVHAPTRMLGVEIEICPAGEQHAADHREHVAIVGRPLNGALVPTAVFPTLLEGRYELYRKPDGPTELVVEVRGGAVSEADWPH